MKKKDNSVILFTKNPALSTLWGSYALGENVIIAHNDSSFKDSLKKGDKQILGIDINAINGEKSEFIQDLLNKFDGLKILILANEPKFSEGKALLAAGIKGYANSYMQEIHFKDALKAIKNGEIWLYPEFIQHMISQLTKTFTQAPKFNGLDELSAREKEIANLIFKGLSNQEISDEIGITLRTVKAHTTSIYSKVGVKDRMGLVLYMREQNG